ncbi:MAG: hypothetical protein GWP03_04585 [Proteobacteria bacterium]|nr:hypothetical protein [Pseudomonadota bacterium]
MGVEKISRKIINDAEAEAKEIIKKANAEAKQQIKEAEEFVKKHNEQHQIALGKAIEEKRMRYIAGVNLDIKKEILGAKREMIDKIIDDTLISITKEKKYEDFLIGMVDQAVENDSEIMLNKEDLKKNKTLIEKELKKKNIKAKISDKIINIKGGFIAKKGKITVDCTIDSIITAKHDEILMKINRLIVE